MKLLQTVTIWLILFTLSPVVAERTRRHWAACDMTTFMKSS